MAGMEKTRKEIPHLLIEKVQDLEPVLGMEIEI